MTKAFSGDIGAFLPTTTIFDETQVRQLDVQSNEFKEFLVNLLQTLNNIALVTNIKESGYYYPGTQFVTGGVYFPDPALTSATTQAPVGRQVVRDTVFWDKAFPNVGSDTLAHGITFDSQLLGVRVYGCATNPGVGFAPIPNQDIRCRISTTNIEITTTSDYSSYTKGLFVIEYLTS